MSDSDGLTVAAGSSDVLIERIAQSLEAIDSPDVIPGSYWEDAEVILAGFMDLPLDQRMKAMGMLPLGHISDDGTTVVFTAPAWGCGAPLYMEATHAD